MLYGPDLFLVVAYSFWILNLIRTGLLRSAVLTEFSCPFVTAFLGLDTTLGGVVVARLVFYNDMTLCGGGEI